MKLRQPRTFTAKLSIVLLVFVVVQAFQLVISSSGFLHIGEEAAFINKAGKQRASILRMGNLPHLAIQSGANLAQYQSWLKEEIADFEASMQEIKTHVGHTRNDDELEPLIAELEIIWQRNMQSLLEGIDLEKPTNVRDAVQAYAALANEQVARLDRVVTILENDVREDSGFSALLSAMLLLLTIALGALALHLTRRNIIRPLSSLAKSAWEIAKGNKDSVIPSSDSENREIQVVSEAFNEMAGKLIAKTTLLDGVNQQAIRLNASLSTEETVNATLDGAIELLNADGAYLAIYEECEAVKPDHEVNYWASKGVSESFSEALDHSSGIDIQKIISHGDYQLRDITDSGVDLTHLERQEKLRLAISYYLTSRNQPIGLLTLCFKSRGTLSADEINALSMFCRLASSAIDNSRLYADTVDKASTDALTGLFNRRSCTEIMLAEVQRSRRYGSVLAVIMVDIDHFKSINDNYGHPAGDRILIQFAQLLKNSVRKMDAVARYGGEEFMLVLPETSGGSAKKMAERFRKIIESNAFHLADHKKIKLTASFGVVCYPRCADDSDTLIERADQALYVAKREGRNRVVLYRDMLKFQLEKDPYLIAEMLNKDLGAIEPIVTAIDVKAGFLRAHCQEVEYLALRLGQMLGLSQPELETLRLAGQLHDIGLISVPDTILRKREKLTVEEYALLKNHPTVSNDILSRVPSLEKVALVVRHHHERVDGRGYPDGLVGEDIPLLSRIIAVTDAYSAITADWPGHIPKSHEHAVKEILAGKGHQFDARVVEAFIELMEHEQDESESERRRVN